MAQSLIQVTLTKGGVLLLDAYSECIVFVEWREMEEVIRQMTLAFNDHISGKG